MNVQISHQLIYHAYLIVLALMDGKSIDESTSIGDDCDDPLTSSGDDDSTGSDESPTRALLIADDDEDECCNVVA